MRRQRLLVLALTVIAAAVGVWMVSDGEDPARRDAQALLDRYGASLRAGRFDEAWARDTTPSYRARTAALPFLTGQLRNAEEHGPPVRLRLSPDALGTTRDEDGTEVVRAVVLWEGERRTAVTVFDLAPTPDGPLVHRTWAWPDDAPAYERVW